ncbi:cilia- and flagella-associated protein 144 isoform X2 [Alligator mississippiensis]|uniref:cilia- and flagella-associated protein 144 isoform X2 n=1 Tax=Alligator mississippiensis TaxID=8496 RepID=UPI002877D480|nr:cilia- and flagella-associated protein 144 isoform X2 [Alligator mississippiensis]
MARLHERFGLAPRWERAGSGAGGAQCSAAGPAPAAKFLNLIHHAALEPIKKYSEPQTESQEIGWTTTPLVRQWPVRRGQARAVGPTFKSREHLLDCVCLDFISFLQISVDRTDRRLYFPRQKSEITKYMEATWRLKEQSENMQ